MGFERIGLMTAAVKLDVELGKGWRPTMARITVVDVDDTDSE